MRSLIPLLRSGSANDDDGATIVVVAITLVVLFGMGALVIDVGNLFWERRQLQTGASAGSLAVAQDIARMVVDPIQSPPSSEGPLGGTFLDTADRYADRNSADGDSDVDELTVSTVGGQPLTEAGEVSVTTLVDGGELDHFLAPVLGIDSSPVGAEASSRYGALVAGEAFPFAFCEDVWRSNRAGPDGTPGPTVEVHYKGSQPPAEPEGCDEDDNFNPGDNPGGFGWLETEDNECATEHDFSDGDETDVPGDPGADIPRTCRDDVDEIEAAIEAHISDPANNELPTRVVPIFSEVDGVGRGADYTLMTFAAFEFSGVKMKGGQNTVVPPGWTLEIPHCRRRGQDHGCVQGRFLREVAPGRVDPDFESDVLGVELHS